jgi:endonuclease/exonuclease/phosphatase family metal-dependent hydrolase
MMVLCSATMLIRLIVIALACLYLLASLGLLVALPWGRRRQRPLPWPVQALAPFVFWLLAPFWLLLALAPVVRAPLYTVAAIAGAGLFLWHTFGRRIARLGRPRQAASGPTLRVMTANLYKANSEYGAMARVILAADPDLLVVQELRADQATALSTRLAARLPFQDLHPGDDAEGMGAFSRYPLCANQVIRQDGANPIQVLRLAGPQTECWAVNMHPRIPVPVQRKVLGANVPVGLLTAPRLEDVQRLVQTAQALPGPLVVLGDMNTTPDCQPFGLIPGEWQDAQAAIGRPPAFTYPVATSFFGFRAPWPLFRIDHVFAAGGCRARAIRTGHMPGSDHRYLVADLTLPAQED